MAHSPCAGLKCNCQTKQKDKSAVPPLPHAFRRDLVPVEGDFSQSLELTQPLLHDASTNHSCRQGPSNQYGRAATARLPLGRQNEDVETAIRLVDNDLPRCRKAERYVEKNADNRKNPEVRSRIDVFLKDRSKVRLYGISELGEAI